jgi:fluoroacetyl-CoA thioesterase
MEALIPLNASERRTLLVEREHTARELGSGSVEVLATPMLIALMEAAALDAVQDYLAEGWTTVGIRVDVEHLRATPLGGKVTAEATLAKREDRVLVFAVQAWDGSGLVGQGTHTRAIINTEKFMNRLKSDT